MTRAKLTGLERDMKILLRRMEAVQRDLLRLEQLRPRPIGVGDKVVMVRAYKGTLAKGTGTVQYLNSWYWRVIFQQHAIVSIPKSQASRCFERVSP